MDSKFKKIKDMLIEFRNLRDWEQFHDPKNLAEAISIEASELLELFLWKKPDDPSIHKNPFRNKVKEEVADIFIFLTYICEAYGIDLFEEVEKKVAINSKKYPIEKAKGTSEKYTNL
jgi:NTP pyrophosphatase (non-canonical NTP hydrolase)